MKILGAELKLWMDEAWPGDDFYWDHDVFETPAPETTYDTDDLGRVKWQGRREDDPTRGHDLLLDDLILKWRKTNGMKTLMVSLPKDQEKAFKHELEKLGGKILN
jgi:hypothetical protein